MLGLRSAPPQPIGLWEVAECASQEGRHEEDRPRGDEETVFHQRDVRLGRRPRAAILLGVNCAYGGHDLGGLSLAALDLQAGWATYPRPKTGIDRRASLWPETVAAVREAIAARPAPKHKADVESLFLSTRGHRWPDDRADNTVGKEFGELLKKLGIHRPGVGFYALRHTFQTIGDGARDPVAVSQIMGHSPPQNDMASVYREGIEDARLVAVADHVRRWLFGAETK
jgi:integrase